MSAAVKFTPGPWMYRHDNQFGRHTFHVYGGCGSVETVKFLAGFDVFAHERKEQNDKNTIAQWERAEANARLIAAAPELLDALKELYSMDGISSDEVTLRYGKARAAIAKATGEQP